MLDFINMTPELEKLLQSSFILRQTLSKVLVPEAVNYIMELIAKDKAHRKCFTVDNKIEN